MLMASPSEYLSDGRSNDRPSPQDVCVVEAGDSISIVRLCSDVALIESCLIYVYPDSDCLIVLCSSRLSKDRERLWLQPANADDTGQYICMLR